MGLLEAKPGVGTFVQALTLESVFALQRSTARLLRPSWDELSAILAVRRSVEPGLAAAAAQCEEPRRRSKLTFSLPVAYRDDPERFLNGQTEFCVAVAEMSGNPIYPMMLRLLLDLYLRADIALQTVRYPDQRERSYTHLCNIRDQIHAREPAAAGVAVADYLDYHQGLVLGLARDQSGANGRRRRDTPRRQRIR